ncbi:hypothetical protein BHM03_00044489 [Ensete ventricosum]|nr:hypothetical protein BHM03_00044489 [Ensete ventricosum]
MSLIRRYALKGLDQADHVLRLLVTSLCHRQDLDHVDRRSPVGRWRLPPLAGAVDLPYGLALAATGHPLAGGHVMVGRPCRGPGHGQPPLQRA